MCVSRRNVKKGVKNHECKCFCPLGLDLASEILDICQEGKAKAIVDAINDWYPELL